ncbi:MAG: ATP-binding protein, partial [Anaerolineae bacterium]|nr:ATP-binding protein [Anaerolineae bacterium]
LTDCYAVVDEHLMSRVLDYLVGNALKFSPAQTSIIVQVEQPSSQISRIKVIDQGNGISDENKELIFDKYKVVELKKSGVSQTGLGLFFCKMVISAHDGKIWIEDNPSGGAVFIFEFPSQTSGPV